MAIQWPTPNLMITPGRDKMGMVLIELKNRLVATGLWRVTGSGDGVASYQNEGQTAGIGGSFDVFAQRADPYYVGADPNLAPSGPNSISKNLAWLQLKEVGSTRTLQISRSFYAVGPNYGGSLYMKFCVNGVQASGAAASKWPPSVGTMPWVNADSSLQNWTGTTEFSTNMNGPDTFVLQLGISDTARAKGVCPFFLALWNASRGIGGGGMFYESLVDAESVNEHPYVFRHGLVSGAASSWANTFGNINTTNGGPFFPQDNNTVSLSATGPNGARWAFDAAYCSPAAAYFPGATPFVFGPSGKWRTGHPRARSLESSASLGRAEHVLTQLIARDYPTTYNLAGPTPYLALGHLLVPWPVGVAPVAGL